MITLSGFTLSNYYNKVKMVLIEKGIPFVEEHCAKASEEMLMCSPLGKVPFIRTEQGSLCESEVIVEYLEALQPEPRLMPADIWGQAKVRELVTFVELHLELVVRELYPEAFFGGKVSDANKARIEKLLSRNIAAFQRLARFEPLPRRPRLHARRLRRLRQPAPGRARHQGHLRHRHAAGRRHRLEGLHQADRAAAERAEGDGGSQADQEASVAARAAAARRTERAGHGFKGGTAMPLSLQELPDLELVGIQRRVGAGIAQP